MKASTSWWGQLADESNRVGEIDRLAAGQLVPAGRGIEGGEQAIFDEYVRVGVEIEQRGLAGIRVTDESHCMIR